MMIIQIFHVLYYASYNTYATSCIYMYLNRSSQRQMKVKKNSQSHKTITSNTREQGSMKNCWAPSVCTQRSAWLCSNYSFVRRRPHSFDPSRLRCYYATTDYKVANNLCVASRSEILFSDKFRACFFEDCWNLLLSNPLILTACSKWTPWIFYRSV
jgi:hypothetical protein